MSPRIKVDIFLIEFISSELSESRGVDIYHKEGPESISRLIWALVSDIFPIRAIESNGG
jgi:hypothetical protein